MKSQNFVILGQFRPKNDLFHKNAIISKKRFWLNFRQVGQKMKKNEKFKKAKK